MVFDNDDRYIDPGGNQNSNETIKYAAHTHTHTGCVCIVYTCAKQLIGALKWA